MLVQVQVQEVFKPRMLLVSWYGSMLVQVQEVFKPRMLLVSW